MTRKRKPRKRKPTMPELLKLIRENGMNAAHLCREAGLDYGWYKKQVKRGSLSAAYRDALVGAILRHLFDILHRASGMEDFGEGQEDLRLAAFFVDCALHPVGVEEEE